MSHPVPTITLAQLREAIDGYPDDFEITFSGLDFYRVKQRGPGLLQIEFNQPVYLDKKGRVVVENLD